MERRTLLKGGLATTGGLLLPASGALTAEAAAAPRIGKVLTRDMRVPWGIAFLPGGNALVGERDSARIYRVNKNGGRKLVGRVPGVLAGGPRLGEGGLLGLALSPNFSRDNWLYAYMSTRSDNRVVRMKYNNGNLGRVHVLRGGIPTGIHHNGGGLAFGPGGLLFVATGDAELAGVAQDRRSLGGKILRMTPDGEAAPGNPFGNYTWSFGHRNPEGITFGPGGVLWSSEFGAKKADELNRIVKGHNYGWPRVEGKDGPGGYHDPLAQWATDVCSPSGVAVLKGRAWLGALRGECVYSVRLTGPRRGAKQRYLTGVFGRIRSVVTAPDGSLWITSSNHDGRATSAHPNDDRVVRILVS